MQFSTTLRNKVRHLLSRQPAARRERNRKRILQHEALETRALLAGNCVASLQGGQLNIQCDELDNQILVLSKEDSFSVRGRGGTSVETTSDDSSVRSIFIDMKDGDDVVRVVRSKLPGQLTVMGGNGNNTTELIGTNFSGQVLVQNQQGKDKLRVAKSSFEGELHVNNGDGESSTVIDRTSIRRVHVQNGHGADKLYLKSSSVAEQMNINNGDGPTRTVITGAEVGELHLQNQRSSDQIALIKSNVAGQVLINNNDGKSATTISSSTIGGDLLVQNGNGYDTLKVDVSKIEGQLLVNNNRGPTRTILSHASVGRDLIVQNQVGNDRLVMTSASVAGQLRVDNGDGGSGTMMSETTIHGDLHLGSGRGRDIVSISHAVIGGRTDMQLGTDADAVDVLFSTFTGDFMADGGADIDRFLEGQTEFGGRFELFNFEFHEVASIISVKPLGDAAEPDKVGGFVVSLDQAAARPITVRYSVGGTATSKADYKPLAGKATIPAGKTEVKIEVVPVDDKTFEPIESVDVTMTLAIGPGAIGKANHAKIAIVDNDDPPIVSIFRSRDAAEPDTTGVFKVSLNSPALADTTIGYKISGTAKPGSDYEKLSGHVLIKEGQTSAPIEVKPIDDKEVEHTETVSLNLVSVHGGPAKIGEHHTDKISLLDNDHQKLPVVSVTGSKSVVEGGEPGSFVIRLNKPAAADTTITFKVEGTAEDGSDYTLSSRREVLIPKGHSAAKINVFPREDNVPEKTETIILRLGDSKGVIVGEPGSAVIQLLDKKVPIPI